VPVVPGRSATKTARCRPRWIRSSPAVDKWSWPPGNTATRLEVSEDMLQLRLLASPPHHTFGSAWRSMSNRASKRFTASRAIGETRYLFCRAIFSAPKTAGEGAAPVGQRQRALEPVVTIPEEVGPRSRRSPRATGLGRFANHSQARRERGAARPAAEASPEPCRHALVGARPRRGSTLSGQRWRQCSHPPPTAERRYIR
jgi:hypothetical protein